jgi:hypothetical protein
MRKIHLLIALTAIAVLLVTLVALADTKGLGLVQTPECVGACKCEVQQMRTSGEPSAPSLAIIRQLGGPLREER